MPKATTDFTDTQRFELDSCPGDGSEEPGFVVLRRMNYGEYLNRRQAAMKMRMEFKASDGQGNRRGRRSGEAEDTTAELDLANRAVTELEFRLCVVDHNLTDANGQLLDFRRVDIMNLLDPRIGDEIAQYIGEMNNWERDLTRGEKEDGSEDGPLASSSVTPFSSTARLMSKAENS